MKKVLKALICATMVLGVGGCGSKTVDFDDTKEKFKENGYYFSQDEKYITVKNDDKSLNFTAIIDDNKKTGSIMFVEKKSSQTAIASKGEDGNIFISFVNEKCTLNYEDADKDKYLETKCTSSDLSDKTEFKSIIERDLKSLDLNFKDLFDFFDKYSDSVK